MKKYFNETIDGCASWGKIFQSKEVFTPLIKEIYKNHSIVFSEISNLTAGTNAVFRISDCVSGSETVIKIFAPPESGFSEGDDFKIELAGINHAVNCGIKTPKPLFTGCLCDRYNFYYIIFEFINGYDFADLRAVMTDEGKRIFASKLKDITTRINIPYKKDDIPDNIVRNIRTNHRYDNLSVSLKEEIYKKALTISRDEYVYVHGDINSDNIILTDHSGDLSIWLIDFADSHIAPYYYEYAPIAFDLFEFDPVLMRAYFGDYLSKDFAHILTNAIALHDFGGDCIVELCKRIGTEKSEVKTLTELEDLIYRFLRNT